MGCIQSKQDGMEEFNSEISANSVGDNITTLAYVKQTEKIPNEMQQNENAEKKVDNIPWEMNKMLAKRRKTRRRKPMLKTLTPSKMRDSIQETDSMYDLRGTALELGNITHYHHHHHHFSFPKWHIHKRSMFCQCNCHGGHGHTHGHGHHHHGHGHAHFDDLPGVSHQPTTQNNQRKYWNNNVNSSGQMMELANLLAMNALELTAPASDALLKSRKNPWVQLAGHPGAFAPAGPHTIWKKRMTKENNETLAYQKLMNDPIRDVIPKFYREVEYNTDFFIEMEDLLQHFQDPSIMDIKIGTRTFLESEVKNPILRKDLYEKMIKLDASEPTDDEHEIKAITKLRYMQFREKCSSTSSLGFRIEALKMTGETPSTDLKKIKTVDEVKRTLAQYLGTNQVVQQKLIARLNHLRDVFETSPYFKTHEIIGSSLLIMYDSHCKCNVWMIDFAKTILCEGRQLDHRTPWAVGNHEDGYLTGVDKLAQVIGELDLEAYASNPNYLDESSEKGLQENSEKDNRKNALKQQNTATRRSGNLSTENSMEKPTTNSAQDVNLKDSECNLKAKTW